MTETMRWYNPLRRVVGNGVGKEEDLVSEAAENLLGRIVALGEEYPDRWVPDDVLWPAANLSYEEYVDAAEELVVGGLAESQANGSEFPFLRATPEGRERVPPL